MNKFIERVMERAKSFYTDEGYIEIKDKSLQAILEQEYDNHDIHALGCGKFIKEGDGVVNFDGYKCGEGGKNSLCKECVSIPI